MAINQSLLAGRLYFIILLFIEMLSFTNIYVFQVEELL